MPALAMPKLRQGSYFRAWLLERRKRAERALTSVVATCYLLGVSTRRMDKLVPQNDLAGWLLWRSTRDIGRFCTSPAQ